jgi:hypothetical protein
MLLKLMNEYSLHSAIKNWYSLPGDKFEVRIDDFIVDIVRETLLIEIQTKNFSAINACMHANTHTETQVYGKNSNLH